MKTFSYIYTKSYGFEMKSKIKIQLTTISVNNLKSNNYQYQVTHYLIKNVDM